MMLQPGRPGTRLKMNDLDAELTDSLKNWRISKTCKRRKASSETVLGTKLLQLRCFSILSYSFSNWTHINKNKTPLL